jgi:hypothetical protein
MATNAIRASATHRTCAILLAGCCAAALLGGVGVGAPSAQEVGPLTSPFADCTADSVTSQDGVNYPDTEIEPWIDANPKDRRNLIAAWQQDRWSNGGARGLPAGVSFDGGATWRTVLIPGTTACTGGSYKRASDPWVTIAPNGTAYYMSLSFDPDLPSGSFGRNAMLVNRSIDGGRSWSDPITLIQDPDGQALNDKNSITADATNANFVYAVWDRLRDFTLPPREGAAAAAGTAVVRPGAGTGDGVVAARRRVQQLRQLAVQRGGAAAPAAAPVVFEGPVYLARTTNGGLTWQRARKIYDPGPNSQTINNLVVVPPSGTVFDFFTEISPNGGTRIGLIRSLDKGATWSGPRYAAVIATVNGVVTPDTEELVRDGSILFDVAVDRRKGDLYLVWQDVRFNGVDEVAFAMSTDGGNRWSVPVKISKTPSNRNELREQVFVPSVEVAANGKLVVTYYDFRFDRDDGREATDYWAVFCDPGRENCRQSANWGDEARLTNRSFNMLDAPIAGGYFLGDYMGLVAANNVVHPVFGEAVRPDVTNIYTRRLNVGGGPLLAEATP